nr:serine protease [Chitinophagaceae bacterium]
EYETSAVLSTKQGTYKNLLAGIDKILGAELENIDEKTAKENNIEGGVLVKKITQGGVISKTRMDDGFIITTVNGMDISNISQMTEAIKNLKGETIQLEGIYPGYDGIYRYPLNMK